MKKTTLVLMLIMIISGLFGFVRDIVLSYLYGATYISDAYLISLTIPTTIVSLVMMGISTGYIPIFTMIVNKKGNKEGIIFTNNLINLIVIISSITIMIGLIFAEEIVLLFASGFEGETLKLTVLFTRISLVGIYFSGLSAILTSYLQVKGSYLLPALCGILTNLIIVLSIVMSHKVNLIFLPVGSVVAFVIQSCILYRISFKHNYKYNFILQFKDENIQRIIFLALPLVVGVAFNQINIVVDRTIASNLNEGAISALTYSNRINLFIQTIVITSVSTIMFPLISNLSSNNNIGKLKLVVKESLVIVALFIVPASMGLLIFSKPIIEFLYLRGAYTIEAVNLTSTALFFYSIGMIAVGIRDILSKVFYSLQDTKTPMINGSIAVVINIILNVVLSKYMGIGGLALATSISSIVCAILLAISLKKRIGSLNLTGFYKTLIKILISSLIMAVGTKIFFEFISDYWTSSISLLISIVLGILIYIVNIYIMKIDDLKKIIMNFKSKGNK